MWQHMRASCSRELVPAGRHRTDDTCAFNAVLYQLSYPGTDYGSGSEIRTRDLLAHEAGGDNRSPNPLLLGVGGAPGDDSNARPPTYKVGAAAS